MSSLLDKFLLPEVASPQGETTGRVSRMETTPGSAGAPVSLPPLVRPATASDLGLLKKLDHASLRTEHHHDPGNPTILEALGYTSRNVGGFSANGQYVGDSRDLNRILELPRRPRPTDFDKLRTGLTFLKKTGPCACQAKFKRKCAKELLDTQAWALTEIRSQRGLVGPIAVGDGKTLLDLLAAMVIPGVKSAVLLIPPALRGQLLDVDWDFYSQHWVLPNLGSGKWFDPNKPTLHVVAYSELSSARNSDILERIKPDLIIADEAHLVRNAGTARTKRFRRYFSAHPQTLFCCWSGTLTTKSLKDYAHLSNLALREGSPTPLHWPTVEEWAGAIDPSDFPSGIGELRKLCAPGEHIREGFRRRFEDTPGVVSSPAHMSCGASLTFSERQTKAPKAVEDALQKLYTSWDRPDGEPLKTALEVHRCAKEISSGFYYRWTWPKKEPIDVRTKWLEVRSRWGREQREKLKQSKEFLDSPLLLTKAAIRWHDGYTHLDPEGRRVEIPPHVRNGPLPVWDSEVWPEWKAVRDTCAPETEGVWIDQWLAADAAEWCRVHPGICWYEHDLFGRRVAELAGRPFYGPGAESSARIISEDASRGIVASIRAHGTGKNLQAFSRNLVANPPSDAAQWEQLIGRTHRQGQLADEVTVEVYRHTAPMIEALAKAKMYATYIQDTMGGSQKLLRATYLFS